MLTRIYSTLLVVLLLSSAAINVLLARERARLVRVIRDLKVEIRTLTEIQSGAPIQRLSVEDASGNGAEIELVASGSGTFLYIFSPKCRWCAENFDSVTRLGELTSGRYKVFGLSTMREGLKDYVLRHRLSFPVYAMLPTDRSGLGTGTPRTLVVSPQGKILENWLGAYGGEVKNRVEQYFQINLPDLPSEPADREAQNRACE